MKPYLANTSEGHLRIMHTLRGIEIDLMERLHKKLELEGGRQLTRPDVLRIAVGRELDRLIAREWELQDVKVRKRGAR